MTTELLQLFCWFKNKMNPTGNGSSVLTSCVVIAMICCSAVFAIDTDCMARWSDAIADTNVAGGTANDAASLNDCKAACVLQPTCYGIDWDIYGGTNCWLTGNGPKRTGQAPNVQHYDITFRLDPVLCSKDCMTRWGGAIADTNVAGGTANGAASLNDCKAACALQPTCYGIDWNIYGGTNCWLTGNGPKRTGQAPNVQHYDITFRLDPVLCSQGDKHIDDETWVMVPTDLQGSYFMQRFPRHMRHEITYFVDDAAAVCNVLGIGVSIVSAGAGALPALLGTILPLLFRGNEEYSINRLISRAIRDERAETLRIKLFGFKNTADTIERQATHNELQQARDRTIGLYDSLNNDRCQFMRMDDFGVIAPYFKAFAKIHLTINVILNVTYANSSHWSENMVKNAREYAEYAHHVVQVITPSEFQSIRDDLRASMANWTKLLPATDRQEFMSSRKDRYRVMFGEPVAFKKYDDCAESDTACRNNHRWIWCSMLVPSCGLDHCLGAQDNPMATADKSRYTYDYNALDECRDSIFFIRSIDDVGRDWLRSCDRVGIYYGRAEMGSPWFGGGSSSRNYWMGVRWLFWSRAGSVLATCPGDDPGKMSDGSCHWERWRVLRVETGDECGVPIKDHDRIFLSAHDRNGPLAPYDGWQQQFVIHRMGPIDYTSYVTACNSMPGKK